MSALSRFASGSIASWARIGISLGTQILLVPLYLHYWSVDQYGCWLAVQTLQGFLAVWTLGHSNFVGFEMLKLNPKDSGRFSKLLSSAIPFAVLIATVELLVTLGLTLTSGVRLFIDSNNALGSDLIRQSGLAVVALGVAGILVVGAGGILGRATAPFGYYPRKAWWDVLYAIVIAAGNVLTVVSGGDVLDTAVVQALVIILYNAPFQADCLRILRRHGVRFVSPDIGLGAGNALKSIAVAGKSGLEILRLQGTRLIISSMVSVPAMVAFSTMRTASNVILQGVTTVTLPVMPELNRYIRERDQEKTWATFGFMWLMLNFMMGPTIVLFQFFIPPLFEVWTHGKVHFDAVVFGLFSVSLLLFSVAQPPTAVLQGQNMLKQQLLVTGLMVFVLIAGMLLSVGSFGLLGAAWSIVAAEMVGLILHGSLAKRWFSQHGMKYPSAIAAVVMASAVVSSAAVMALCALDGYRFWILGFFALLQAALAAVFWRRLPLVARQKIAGLLARGRRQLAGSAR